MRISIISFTENGKKLSEKIAAIMTDEECVLYTKAAVLSEDKNVIFVTKNICAWAGEQMQEKNVLLFIGACGIAVRAIAPHLTDKLHDSPVLVLDEKGTYVIPILSGHMGGANAFAEELAEKIGAVAVITTATDIQNKFAVDLFAKKNGIFITDKDGIAKVSSKVLAGAQVCMAIEPGHLCENAKLPEGLRLTDYPPTQKVDVIVTSSEELFDAVLVLKPKEYVIGMGCKKGKEAAKIEEFILRSINQLKIPESQIFALASIEQKKEEAGFLSFSARRNLPFLTYTAEELEKVEGTFAESAFVKATVGVSNVCERAALKAAGKNGKLIYKKHAEDGMTIAIAKREWSVKFE